MKILYYLFFIGMLLTGCAIQTQHSRYTSSPLEAYYKNQNKRASFVASHPGLSPAIKQAITAGKIIKGMDKATIEDLFGPPEKKHILENGLMEIWFYDNSHFAFVFDKNNKIIRFFPPESLNLK
ncbi:MAG: hypothetical protein M1135_00720 [Candidatus Omnitrophica bacterium]|nr:hypothetical protein [Candidatus Omnitrophota bacterium]